MYKDRKVDGILEIYSNIISMLVKGIPSTVVYVVDYSTTGDAIIGRKELTSLADLKGRKVSFDGINTASHLYVLKALENVGLNESNTQFAVLESTEVLLAIKNGSIDAGYAWEPDISNAVTQGYRVLSTAGDIPGSITDVLAFHPQVVAERPQDVQAVVKSLVEAQTFAITHNVEALAIMAQAMSHSPEEISAGITGVVHLDLQANIVAMTRSEAPTSLYGSGEFFTRFLLNRGQLVKMPDLDQLIDARFVQHLQ